MNRTLFCLKIITSICVICEVNAYISDTTASTEYFNPSDTTGTYCVGNEWVPHEDEKCFKLIREYTNRDKAEAICNNERLQTDSFAPTLASIKSAAEQEYLTKYVFSISEVQVDVWIGAIRKENGNQFIWNDGSDLGFTNWAEGSPSEEIGKDCVVMKSRLTKQISNISDFDNRAINGKWKDVTCQAGNWVLCQKLQTWSFPQLQKAFLDVRDDLKDTRNELHNTKKQLENTTTQLTDTRNQLDDIRKKLSTSAPAGTIAFFARNTAPTGWLEANGEAVSRTMYADLFTAIGTTFGNGDGSKTFKLPDLRGEFIRGWSNGREVDKGRTLGSFQWGSNIPMAGYVGSISWRAMADAYQDQWGFAGDTFDEGFEGNIPPGETRSGTTFPDYMVTCYVGSTNCDLITSWNVWKGTRPRNVALLACIKY